MTEAFASDSFPPTNGSKPIAPRVAVAAAMALTPPRNCLRFLSMDFLSSDEGWIAGTTIGRSLSIFTRVLRSVGLRTRPFPAGHRREQSVLDYCLLTAEKGAQIPGRARPDRDAIRDLGFVRISYYAELDLQTILVKFDRQLSALSRPYFPNRSNPSSCIGFMLSHWESLRQGRRHDQSRVRLSRFPHSLERRRP